MRIAAVRIAEKSAGPIQLKIQERQNSEVTILELEGQLILGPEANALRNRIKKLLKAGRNKILLQLRKVVRLDSVGVGTMIDAVNAARRAGGDLRLLQLSQPAQKVFDLIGANSRPDLLRLFGDEQEAINSFALPPGEDSAAGAGVRGDKAMPGGGTSVLRASGAEGSR